jgi:hypothetical protein
MPLHLSSVKDMYRFKNLRADGTGRADSLGIPANRPDAETSGTNFVFVHGYNVSAEQGEATHSEVFKRMYQSGFNGKFWGVSWYGDVDAKLHWLFKGSHYHNSVIQAFAAAPKLRDFLTNPQYFSSPPDLAAHSLGNGVVGFALNDAAGNIVRNYFALDAAMALEAFGDNSQSADMLFWGIRINAFSETIDVPSYSWTNYPTNTWASEWHTLFAGTSDYRSELTWRNRCTGAVSRVSGAYNFYSSTEEVLRVDENLRAYAQALWPVGCNSWQIQECYKGRNVKLPEWVAGGSSRYAGWGVTEYKSSTNVCKLWDNLTQQWAYILRPPFWVQQQLANSQSGYEVALQSDPLFRQEPRILFSPSGSKFVNGRVSDNAYTLDYANETVKDVRIRDWLLAKAFPARTRPMGSTAIDLGAGWIKNYNMASDSASYENGLMLHGWPRTEEYRGALQWWHGDYKDVAYIYVQELYKKWVELSQ